MLSCCSNGGSSAAQEYGFLPRAARRCFRNGVLLLTSIFRLSASCYCMGLASTYMPGRASACGAQPGMPDLEQVTYSGLLPGMHMLVRPSGVNHAQPPVLSHSALMHTAGPVVRTHKTADAGCSSAGGHAPCSPACMASSLNSRSPHSLCIAQGTASRLAQRMPCCTAASPWVIQDDVDPVFATLLDWPSFSVRVAEVQPARLLRCCCLLSAVCRHARPFTDMDTPMGGCAHPAPALLAACSAHRPFFLSADGCQLLSAGAWRQRSGC